MPFEVIPSKLKQKKATITLGAEFSAEEGAAIKALAAEKQCGISDFVRQCIRFSVKELNK